MTSEQNISHPSPSISWTTLEYQYRPKEPSWYASVVIIALALSAGAFIVSNYLFGVLVIVAGFSFALLGARHPIEIECEISKAGIRAGNQLYPHNGIQSFWVLDIDDFPRIILRSTRFFLPQIIIPIGSADPEAIRGTLAAYLKEEEQEEPITQRIMDRLGF
jgi:hypothetical protein